MKARQKSEILAHLSKSQMNQRFSFIRNLIGGNFK